MTYRVEVCDEGGRWRELHPRRRYTLTAALTAFHAEQERGTRGVRIMRGDEQIEAYWPRQAA